MIIGGVQWMTLLDYPGQVAATLFTAGCNFRCPFCHNADLVLPELVAKTGVELKNDFFDEITERFGFLDAIAITGGEPTLQPDLLSVIKRIKEIGYLVKLDTNGSHPEVIQAALDRNLLDYIAMDVKAPMDLYKQVAGVPVNTELIQQSISLLRESGIDYEFRTTVAPGISREDIFNIAKGLSGSRAYWLQEFQAPLEKTLVNEVYRKISALRGKELKAIWEQLQALFEIGGVRS